MPQITLQDLQDQEKFTQLKGKITDRNTFNLGYLTQQYENAPTNTTYQKNLLDAVNARLSSFNNTRANYTDALANDPTGQRAQQFKPQYEQILNQLPDYLKPEYDVGQVKQITTSEEQAALSQKQYQEQQQAQQQQQQAQYLTPEERAKFNIPETQPQQPAQGQEPQPQQPQDQATGQVSAAIQPQQTVAPAQGQEQLAQTVEQQAQQNPKALANTAYVNGVFKAYHGRDANAGELARYSQMSVEQALKEIKGGAPQALTTDQQTEIQSLQQNGFVRVDNPQQLSDMAKQLGLTEDNIVRVGAKIFVPSNFKVKVNSTISTQDLADPKKEIDITKYSGGTTSDIPSDTLYEAATNYADQYASGMPDTFAEARAEYWKQAFDNGNFRTELIDTLEDQFGIDELSQKLSDIDTQIAVKQQAWNTLLEDNRNAPVSMAMITGREAHIKRMASIEIDGLLGQRDAIAGDYDRAYQRIENAYNAAVGDYEQRINTVKDFYNEQKEFFTTQEQRAYDAKIRAMDQEFELYKQDLSDMRNLMVKYPAAGISLNDSFDEATRKAGIAYMNELSRDVEKGNFQFVETDSGNFIFNKDTGQFESISGGQYNSNEIFKNLQSQGLTSENIGGREVTGNSIFMSLLKRADADMRADGLEGLQINQDFRTQEQQAALYKELSAKGARVAPPGLSFHEKGLAVDVSNWEKAAPYLSRYGIVNGLQDDMGHFSLGEMNPNILNKLPDIFPELKPISPEAESLKGKYDLLTSIEKSRGLNSSVGSLGIFRIPLLDVFGAKDTFISSVEQLISQETLDTLVNAKKQGATFGALSETELEILKAAASKIGSRRVKDKNGNIIGYDLPETEFKNEIKRLKTLAYNALERSGYSHLAEKPISSSDILATFNVK